MAINKVDQSQGNTTWTVEMNGEIIGMLVKNTSSRTSQPWKVFKGYGSTMAIGMIGYSFESRDAAVAILVAACS